MYYILPQNWRFVQSKQMKTYWARWYTVYIAAILISSILATRLTHPTHCLWLWVWMMHNVIPFFRKGCTDTTFSFQASLYIQYKSINRKHTYSILFVELLSKPEYDSFKIENSFIWKILPKLFGDAEQTVFLWF